MATPTTEECAGATVFHEVLCWARAVLAREGVCAPEQEGQSEKPVWEECLEQGDGNSVQLESCSGPDPQQATGQGAQQLRVLNFISRALRIQGLQRDYNSKDL